MLTEAIDDQRADWECECEDVRRTFAAWSRAPMTERGRAFADYRLALEREEQASIIYRDLLAEARELCSSNGDLPAAKLDKARRSCAPASGSRARRGAERRTGGARVFE